MFFSFDAAAAPSAHGRFQELNATNNPFHGSLPCGMDGYPFVEGIRFPDRASLNVLVGCPDGQIYYYDNNFTLLDPTNPENPFQGVDVGNYATISCADIIGLDQIPECVLSNQDGDLFLYVFDGTHFNLYTEGQQHFPTLPYVNYGKPHLVDIDQNGMVDLVMGDSMNRLEVFFNTGGAMFPIFVQTWTNILQTNAGNHRHAVFADFDLDGDLDVFVAQQRTNGFVIDFYQNTLIECNSDCTIARGQCAEGGTPSDPIYFMVEAFQSSSVGGGVGMCICRAEFVGEHCEQCEETRYGIDCDATCPSHSRTNLTKGELVYPLGPSIEDCICDPGFEKVVTDESGHFQCLCPPGNYYSKILNVCLPCDVGTFKSSHGNYDCTLCEGIIGPRSTTIQSGSTGSESCVCKSTFFLVNGSGCVCPNGSFLNVNTDTCDECPKNSFQDETGLFTTCRSCATVLGNRSITISSGATSMAFCTCPATFEAHLTIGECVCPPGRQFNVEIEACEACPVSFYSTKSDLEPCTSCTQEWSPRSTTLTIGSTVREACTCRANLVNFNGTCLCSPGMRYDTNTEACVACPIGTFQSEYNIDNTCISCAATFNNEVLMTTKAEGSTGSQQCVCQDTFYWNEEERICGCPAGYGYDVESGFCEKCRKGFFSDVHNRDPCASCANVLASDEATTGGTGSQDAESCTCSRPFVMDSGTCTCAPGYGFLNETGTCQKCLIGFFSEVYSSNRVNPAPPLQMIPSQRLRLTALATGNHVFAWPISSKITTTWGNVCVDQVKNSTWRR